MIRVAAYCRVSTDQSDQLNSLAAQKRYFEEYISREPGWELYEIYADEGLSGTDIRKRTAFNCMMREAKAGRFQLVLTKEVSRFSRNILDTISCTRELKAYGIGVVFVTDGISTMEPDAELRLSIMASLAQEESRKTSVRVKWGQTRQMERGVVFGHSLMGYGLKNGVLTVREDEAQVVRRIFHLYAEEGYRSGEIAEKLRAERVPKPNGETDWSSRYILRILKNEKYAGDLVQKKSCTPDYLSHSKKPNRGQEKLIVLRDHHEAIVDRDLWNLAQQAVRQRRSGDGKTGHSLPRLGLSGKIRCGECGALFLCRQKRGKNGTITRRWSCGTVVKHGADPAHGGCDVGRLIREDDIRSMLHRTLEALCLDRGELAADTAGLVEAVDAEVAEDERKQMGKWMREEREILAKKEAVMDACFAGEIRKDEMLQMKQYYDTRLKWLKGKMESVKRLGSTDKGAKEKTEGLKDELLAILKAGEQNSNLAEQLLDQLTVFQDRHLELRLIGLDTVFIFR